MTKGDRLELSKRTWTDGSKYVIAHVDSCPSITRQADFVGCSPEALLQWIVEHEFVHSTIWIDADQDIINQMKQLRPELDIRIIS